MKNHDDSKKPANAGEHALPDHDVKITKAEYLRAVKAQLRSGKQKSAYGVLLQAVAQYPDDPLILSYYGCFQALVDKKYRSGVETCKKALAMLKATESFGEEVLYPVFYLNLGRAYLAAGKKPDAIDAFKKGLKYDNTNSDLQKELRGLGVRKKPPVPFLDRSNPVNKYVGIILHKAKKEPGKSGGKGAR